MADRRSAWYQWVIESFDLARVDYYMKCYIRRPSWAPSRSIAHGWKPSGPPVRAEFRLANANLSSV